MPSLCSGSIARTTLALLALLALAPSVSAAQSVGVQIELEAPAPPPIPPPPPIPAPPPVVMRPAPATLVVEGESQPVRVIGTAQGPQIPVRLVFEGSLGWLNMDPRVEGTAGSLGIGFDFAFTEWFALGLHGGWVITPDVSRDLDLDGVDDDLGAISMLTITAGPRFRILTAPNGDAFTFELGGGYLYGVDGLRPSGAVIELAIARWGMLEGGAGGGPMLRLQQGLGDAGSYSAILLGVQGGFDTSGAPSPSGRSDWRYTLGFEGGLGAGFLEQGPISHGFAAQLGVAFGVPIADVIEPRVRVDFMHRRRGEEGDGLDAYGFSGGLRVLLDPWAPVYFEAAGGWALRLGRHEAFVPGGAFLDVGAGARFADCEQNNVAVTLGVRARIGLDQGDALTSVFAVLGVEYDSLPPSMRPRCIPSPPEPRVQVAIPEAPEYRPTAPSTPRPHVAPTPRQPPSARPGGRVDYVASAPAEPSGPVRIPLRLGFEAWVGLGDSDLSMEGPLGGAAITMGVAFDQNFGFDLRLQALGGPDELRQSGLTLDGNDALSTPDLMLLAVGAGPRFMVWSDEAHRLGWLFELTGSYAYLEGTPGLELSTSADRIGRHGAILELALGPQLGARGSDGFGYDFGLTLRLQQGLGDLVEYRAILLGLRLGFEADTPEPGHPGGGLADFQYTVGGRIDFGFSPGADEARGIERLQSVTRFSGHFGLPIGRWFEVRARGGIGPRSIGHDAAIAILDVQGAARLRFDEVFPLYIDAGAGYAFQYGAAASQAPAGAFVEAGIGARFTDCSGTSDGALELGVAARFGVDSDRTNDALFLVLGYEYAGGAPMFGRNERWHCQSIMRQREPGEEDEYRAPPPPPRDRLDYETETEVLVVPDLGPPPLPPAPTPSPTPLAPQSFEVIIGLAFGPGLEISLRPEMLPLSALAGAGYVEVEIIGPPIAAARAEAQLRASFSSRGARLDAVVHTSGFDPTVRARITVYPPR